MTDGILVGCIIFSLGIGVAGIADLACHLFRHAWRSRAGAAGEVPPVGLTASGGTDPRAGYTLARTGEKP